MTLKQNGPEDDATGQWGTLFPRSGAGSSRAGLESVVVCSGEGKAEVLRLHQSPDGGGKPAHGRLPGGQGSK